MFYCNFGKIQIFKNFKLANTLILPNAVVLISESDVCCAGYSTYTVALHTQRKVKFDNKPE